MPMTKSELKVINCQLEILTEFKCEVDHLLSTINQVIDDGRSRTEGIQKNKTYHEINQYLTVETSNCIKNCQSIARERQSLCPSTPEIDDIILCQTSESIMKDDNDYKIIKEKMDHLSKCVTSLQETVGKNELHISLFNKQTDKNEEKIKNISTKNRNLESEIEIINKQMNEIKAKSESKIEEIMEELHRASNFMSDLQTQIEAVSHETIENETKIKDFSVKVNESENKTSLHSSLLETLRQDIQSTFCVQNELIQNIEENIKNTNEINKANLIGINNELKESKDFIFKMTTNWETLKDEVNKMEENVTKHQNMTDPLKKDFLDLTFLVTKLEKSTKTLSKKQTENSTELQNQLIIIETKLTNTSSQAENISSLVTELQSKTKKIGFNVQVHPDVVIDVQHDGILKCFNQVIDNYGYNYDITSGIFTAPVNGLYLFGLFITKRNETDISIYFTVKDLSGEEIDKSGVFCQSKTSSGSVVVPLSLSKSEQVYLRSGGQYSKLQLTLDSFYIGVLISEC